ncbi:cyclase family protein [Candidatus Palauibacter sp.]|uniref:cyclase family protein n=1 Tax=Candidatus Palauibacter sp. TaxID=3101350 RepID=UPI003AF2DFAD
MPKLELRFLAASVLVGCAALAACSVWVETPDDRRPGPSGAGDPGVELDLTTFEIVDLTHAFGPETIYWPTDTTGFLLEQLAFGETDGGYFYSAYALATAEHGGTHIDAPIHFHEGGVDAASIPLRRLLGPAVVIDITAQAAGAVDYRLTPADVEAHEAEHGEIPPGSLILLRTDWSARWPDALGYLGDDTPGDASSLHFPSYGDEAARLLVEERGAAVLGADVASIDYGPSTDFTVHQIAAAAGVPSLENLTNLDQVPARGATVIALPMKISGGSGGPLRAIALVPGSVPSGER